MAYVTPAQWSHGDFPSALELNRVGDDLEVIHAKTGDANLFYPVYVGSDPTLWLVRRYRWLAHDDNGTIVDPAGVGATVTIADPGSGSTIGYYDLDSIDWLVQGKLYTVVDVNWAMEVRSP